MFVMLIAIILFINLMWAIPVFGQWNLYDLINDELFKKVKIKGKISFFFKAIGGQSVANHGIIKSLLILQIKGYILSLFSIVFLLVVGLIIKNLFLCFTVIGIGLAIAVLVDIITVVVLMLESRRRNDMTKKYN